MATVDADFVKTKLLLTKPSLSDLAVVQLLQDRYTRNTSSDEVSLDQLVSYDDLNFLVTCLHTGDKYVLKICNPEETAQPGLLDMRTAMMSHVHKAGFACPNPITDNFGSMYSELEVSAPRGRTVTYGVYLLSFVPGEVMSKFPLSDALLRDMGRELAELAVVMRGCRHPALTTRTGFHWDLQNACYLVPLLDLFDDLEGKRSLLDGALGEFIEAFDRTRHNLGRGVIHGDFNNHNILMENTAGKMKIAGTIDFGDICYSYTVFDVAILIMYTILELKTDEERLDAGGHILAGYLMVQALTQAEWDIIFQAVKMRFVQSLCIGYLTHTVHPDNEYLLDSSYEGWNCLRLLQQQQQREIIARWKRIARA